ncbi:MAG: HAD family hydrolase [Spirochaetales bacterium]|nr:HAD family hydrolase [Spirochaetales bacterium]
MKIKAVAFDIDGTLYPEYKMFITSSIIALRYPIFINNFRVVRKQIRAYNKVDDFYKLQAVLLAKRMRITVSKAEQLIENVIYSKWPAVFKYIKPYKGVKALLLRLKQMKIKIAVLSDLPVEEKLRYLKLNGIWDCAFSSEETGYLKPHPVPFRELLKKLGTKPNSTLYVGNNYKYDIIGASKLGIKTAHLSHKPHKQSIADFTFKDYKNLENFLLTMIHPS